MHRGFVISANTDCPKWAKFGDYYLAGNVVPQRFAVEEMPPTDDGHDRIKIVAPNGESIVYVAWCGRHPCQSNWDHVAAWMTKHQSP